MRRTHRSNHDHVNRNLLHTSNLHLNNIHKVLHQDGEGGGNKPGVILDHVSSALNDMKSHTGLIESRALLIANHLTQGGDGSGSKAGEILDSCSSSLNDMKGHTSLIESRALLIANHLTQGGDGSGSKAGEILDSCASRLGDISSNASLTASRLDNCQVDLAAIEVLLTTQATANDLINTKLTSLETDVEATNTLLTTMDGVLDNILTKNTEIDTACDLNNSRGDELYMDTHVAHISNGAIAQWALMSASGGAEIDMVGSTGYQYRDVTIYGKTTTSTAKLHFAGASSSGGTFYINPTHASLQADNSSNYHFIMTWENCPFRYVDVLASVAPAGLYLSSIKSKHR